MAWGSANNHRYNPVEENDETKGLVDDVQLNREPQFTKTRSPVVKTWWKFLLCNLLAACVGAGVMYGILHATQNSTADVATLPESSTNVTLPDQSLTISKPVEGEIKEAEILDCGGNPEEAREKGCVFDVMMQDWVPEPCYDSVLTERYLAEGNYTWYADGQGETTLSDEEMRKGEHGGAWMSTSYHKAHCIFSWMKTIRALRNERGISQELLSYDHVMHCGHGALTQDSNDRGLGVKAPTNYAKCALYDTWKTDFIPDKHDSTG